MSALDVSTQNQVINLLEDLRGRFGLSYLFIAHDLAVVRHIAHEVAVMYLGHVVESGPTDRVYDSPAHPYTQALLSAIPASHPCDAGTGKRMLLTGDLPDPANPPEGCAFVTRCPFANGRVPGGGAGRDAGRGRRRRGLSPADHRPGAGR
ncbi:ABC transporter ATP-binding protein [Pseudonocardia sp. UM4_GMWB1]|uniref:ABC transporter ATP-binding protein n=1 Tax=Pseudonocardia sp. UM4_GMWB1 TaxID=2212989 RepID=UPI00307EC3EC